MLPPPHLVESHFHCYDFLVSLLPLGLYYYLCPSSFVQMELPDKLVYSKRLA
jgi:hypothetical protein